MKKEKVRVRTKVFTSFMIAFFGMTMYLTYYSEVVRERNLPVVQTVLPQYCQEQSDEKARYEVPPKAILRDAKNQPYLLVVHLESDILGDRYHTASLHVWLKGETEDGMCIVEGIVRAEPIVAEPGTELFPGMEVKPASNLYGD